MIAVIGPDEHVYIPAQSTSGIALDRAVNRFDPFLQTMPQKSRRYQTRSRETWERMKKAGYYLVECGLPE